MKCVAIHGSNPKELSYIKEAWYVPQNKRNWFSWLKKELEKRKINCFFPLMPKSWNPNYNEWKKEIEKINIDDETILVGHSLGASFLVRWLSDSPKKVKKLILIVPTKNISDFPSLKDFYDFDINEKIKDFVGDIVIFTSDSEKESWKKDAKIYTEKLRARLIILKNKGHFIKKHMGTEEFPELLREVLK